MKIRNEIQRKMKCSTSMIRSYQSINNIKTINNRSQESGLRAACYRIIFILLSITIGSCYSIESDCGGFKDGEVSPDGSIFATAQDKGVLKSTNKGVTWSFVNNGMREVFVTSIIYNSITMDIFAGTTAMDDDGMIYRSTNFGAKWELANSGILKSSMIYAFAFNPNTGQMYAATTGGVYRSKNYPEPYRTDFWERTNEISAYSMAVANNGDIWIGTVSSEVFLSTNNGDTWVQKNDVRLGNLGSSVAIAINPINGYIFYCNKNEGLFRSTDNGESWVNVISNLVDVGAILITTSGEIYFGSAAFGPMSSKVYYSNDNGDTWIERSNGLLAISSLALGADGILYAGTFYGGVYRSTDGGDTWLPPSNYNNNVWIRGLTIAD